MCFVRSTFAAVSIVVIATSGAAVAQPRVPSAETSSTVDDVSKWTTKHWNQAKAKWAKEKVKWSDCEKEAKDQKLTGRKSWSFIYDCMTK
jgi:hypothetical protein